MSNPTIICLTPVKNEAWILERFLKCTSLWADYIIIADQGSDDGSREIARRFPKVILVDNPSAKFNEPERQKMLIEAARDIPGPRLLVALDADEFLTGNFTTSPEWDSVLRLPKGTIVRFQWAIVRSDLGTYYDYPDEFPLGFVDDGSPHIGREIHSPRIPIPPKAPSLYLREIKVIHYSCYDFSRFDSKVRWYQCWETLHHPTPRFPNKRPIDIYRFLHRDYGIPSDQMKPIPESWFQYYWQHDIDMTSVFREPHYRWDKEILQLFAEHGVQKFRRTAIWDVNWSKKYREVYETAPEIDLEDPRNHLEKFVHRWLKATQPYYSHFPASQSFWDAIYSQLVLKALRFLKW